MRFEVLNYATLNLDIYNPLVIEDIYHYHADSFGADDYVFINMHFNVVKDYLQDYLQDYLARLFVKHGVKLIDPLMAITKDIANNLYFDHSHYSHRGMAVVANVLFDFMKNDNNDWVSKVVNTPPARNGSALPSSPEIEIYGLSMEEYLRYLRLNRKEADNIGCIVVNCNPFTLGHRYLIEYAASKVNHLYVFVVEEDKSYFKFSDRYAMVQNGIMDLENVSVLKSGKFILSSDTFGEYFNKDELQSAIVNPQMDLDIFAQSIVPALGIKVRFAGEEPNDNVTHQYNMAMKKLLPKYGVEFHEVQRKEVDGKPVSASKVREYLLTGEYPQLANIVPQSTIKYLAERGYINER